MEFPAHLEQLPEMLKFICSQAETFGIPADKLYKIELASEEALVNIISYAYPDHAHKMLSIECLKSKEGRFEIVMRDKGIPFNPIDVEIDVDIHKSVEDRKIGGLGIFMIRKLVDEVSYQRQGDENILKISMSP